MRIPGVAIAVVCAAAAGGCGTVAAFNSPSTPLRMTGGQQQRDLQPRDLIASNLRLRQAFTLTNTLRWEIRSTLTSDEEASKTSAEDDPLADLPAFPEQMSNGIWDIQTPEQHT